MKTDKNLNKNIENTSLKMRNNPKYQEISPIYLPLTILLNLVFLTHLISSIPTLTLCSTLLTLAKHRHKRPQQYSIQSNLLTSLDICFIMNNFY